MANSATPRGRPSRSWVPVSSERPSPATSGAQRFRRASEQGQGAEDMAAGYFASFDE